MLWRSSLFCILEYILSNNATNGSEEKFDYMQNPSIVGETAPSSSSVVHDENPQPDPPNYATPGKSYSRVEVKSVSCLR